MAVYEVTDSYTVPMHKQVKGGINMVHKDTKKLEQRIGYGFKDFNLLRHAVTHSSYANEQHMGKLANNERLEFLGDAVLEIIVSEFLYHEYNQEPEGILTRKRASIVCEQTLALCAREIGLGEFLLLGKGEELTGGRERNSIISDAMEALIGAIYLDGGFANAKEFIKKYVLTDIENKQLFFDSKTILQEIVQSKEHCELSYRLIKEEGPDHNKKFVVEALVGDKVYGTGAGSTKKAAEQEAAYRVILALRAEENE